MFYRLKEPWAFRGWKKTPYALQAQGGAKELDRPLFMEKAPFLDLLYCNGEEDVDEERFCEEARRILHEMLENGAMESSDRPMKPLQSWQRYHIHPGRYIEGVHWSITGQCNMRCRHCLVSAPLARHPQLPLEDCLAIVRQLAVCGVKRVDLTGGEPLVRSDFAEIVKVLTRAGISVGVLYANASLLTEATLQTLEDCGQQPVFQVSFDGLGHHDWLRGVPGAERQTDAALRLLQRRGAHVIAAMCIHRNNRGSLRATAAYLSGLGVHLMRVNAPQRLGLWKEYAAEYALTEDEVWETYRAFIADYFADGAPIGVELDGYFSCQGGGSADYRVPYVHHPGPGMDWNKCPLCESVQYNLHISPEGLVAPCMGFCGTALRDRLPNVLETPLSEITAESFYQDLVNTRVADLLARNPECAACAHLPECCGGCMVQDITDAGDYLVPDSRCCYFHKHIGEAAVRAAADAAIRKNPNLVSGKSRA